MAGVPLDKYAKHRDALLADKDNWDLTNRPAMLPFLGEYTNKNTGEKSGGFAWPSMVTEPVNAYKRLTDAMRGDNGELTLPNPQNPDNQRDMVTALLGLYGGNASAGLARGAGVMGREIGAAEQNLAVRSAVPPSLAPLQAPKAARIARGEHPQVTAWRDEMVAIHKRIEDRSAKVDPAQYPGYLIPEDVIQRMDAADRPDMARLSELDDLIQGARDGSNPPPPFVRPEPKSLALDDAAIGREIERELLAGNARIMKEIAAIEAQRVQRSASHLSDGPEAPLIGRHLARNADTIINEEQAYSDALAAAAYYKNAFGNTLHADTGRPSIIGSALAGQYGENALNPLAKVPAGALRANGLRSAWPDEATRQADARKMDMRNEVVYHGTNAKEDFDAFDLSFGGHRARSRAGLQGVSVSPDASVSDEFAGAAFGGFGDGSRVLPLRYRSSRQGKIALTGEEKNHEIAATLAEAWDAGFDSVRMANYTTPNGQTGKEIIVVRNPNQLRSVNARFDPARMNEPGLMLSDTGRPSIIGSALAGQYGENAAKASSGIKGYHGSPHDFDRFSIDKIGSGEGAQVYGHGLYLAEKEGVARSYRDALSQSGNPMYSARNDIVAYGGDVDAALANAQRMVDKGVKQYEPVRDYIRAMKNGEEPAAPGRMYEVNINADPDHFIDWDKPFGDQPPAARSVLEADPSFATASSGPDEFMREAVKDPQIASRLRDAGVPGVKYLDQNSRIKGEGSRNYVVFDDNLIEILRKYGLLPPAVAASQMFPDDENTF